MYELNPFGNPDGSRENIENMMTDFISFDSRYYPIMETNFRTRVIVGAKGSGKTVYLRRMQALMKENDSVYIGEIATELPHTDVIVRFCQLFDINTLTEKWMLLWRCALLRALVSNIIGSKRLRDYLDEDEILSIEKYNDVLFPPLHLPMDVYTEARDILSYYETKSAYEEYFSRREWDELDVILSQILSKLPPIYFFVDCIDEEYSHAPMYWMRCQKGLFYRCMRFLRHPVYGNRFHIVICVREQVMSSVYQSEHSTRYMHDSHILSLNWNYRSIEYFFQHKISRLKDCYFDNFDDRHGKSIENWIGVRTVKNVVRNIEEPITEYVLRHTRLSPRDVVEIGNALADIRRESMGVDNYDIQAEIRNKVSHSSRSFGGELLKICANQIINNQMPDSAGRMEYSEVYTSIQEYEELTSTSLRKILAMLPSDRFSWGEIEQLNKVISVEDLLPEGHHMFDILWQNSAIGYVELGANGDKEEVFFVDRNYELFTLPKNKHEYILRSCLIDCIERTDTVSKYPVLGGNK